MAERSEGSAFAPWAVPALIAWALAVIAVAVVTHTVDGAGLCSTTEVTTPEERSVEETVTGSGAGADDVSTRRVTTAATVQRTEVCEGLSPAQVAVLLLPGLLLLVPALRSVDVAGLFELSFREVEAKLEHQGEAITKVAKDVAEIRLAQETFVNMGVTQTLHVYQGAEEAGRLVRLGHEAAERGATLSFEEVFGPDDGTGAGEEQAGREPPSTEPAADATPDD